MWEHRYNEEFFGTTVYFDNLIKTSDNSLMVLESDLTNYVLYKLGGTLGVNDVTKKSLSVYPNPVKDILHFSEEVSNIRIVDISGRVVKQISGLEKTLDVSKLAKGVYIITATTKAGKTITNKIIKD